MTFESKWRADTEEFAEKAVLTDNRSLYVINDTAYIDANL